MINCPNCGGLNGNGNPTCSFCGASLINNSIDPNLVNIQSTDRFVEPTYDNQDMGAFAGQPAYVPNSMPESFPDAEENANSETDYFVDAYIKKNVDKIKTKGFSIWAFLFGGIYIWYRKMYKLLLIYIGLNFVISSLFTLLGISMLAFIPSLAFNVFLGIKFKELYLKDVTAKVAAIKSNNSEELPEKIALICSKKGGTTIIPMIVGPILLITIIALVVVAFTLLVKGPDGGGNSYTKKAEMYEKASLLIDAVRADMLTNSIKDNTKIYDINDLNDILDSKLSLSPFGKNYVYAKVQAIKTMDGSYIYRVCMIDEERNGFGYTNEVSLSADSVLEGTAPDGC